MFMHIDSIDYMCNIVSPVSFLFIVYNVNSTLYTMYIALVYVYRGCSKPFCLLAFVIIVLLCLLLL